MEQIGKHRFDEHANFAIDWKFVREMRQTSRIRKELKAERCAKRWQKVRKWLGMSYAFGMGFQATSLFVH